MFNQVGWGEFALLLVVGLFVFGPERLPQVARDAGRMLRQLRRMATGLTDELKAELGPEVGDLDLASLHPRRFVQKHLFEDDPDEPPASNGDRPKPGSGGPPLAKGERAPYDADAT